MKLQEIKDCLKIGRSNADRLRAKTIHDTVNVRYSATGYDLRTFNQIVSDVIQAAGVNIDRPLTGGTANAVMAWLERKGGC